MADGVTVLNEVIAKEIKERAAEALGIARTALVEEELARRGELIRRAVVKWRAAMADLKKLKPDAVVYSTEGVVQSEGYSKARLDERGKLTSLCERLDAAVAKAVDGDYSNLDNLVGKEEPKPEGSNAEPQ